VGDDFEIYQDDQEEEGPIKGSMGHVQQVQQADPFDPEFHDAMLSRLVPPVRQV
jgi:hypothetical protein